MFAGFLILLLVLAATAQIAGVVKVHRAVGSRSLLRCALVICVGLSAVVASFDTYVIASESVKYWQLERKAATWRTEDTTLCQQGDGDACLKLAMLWMWGTGGPVDVAEAFALAKRGCDLGNNYACKLVDEVVADGGPERYFYRRRLRWPPTRSDG